MDLLTEKQVSDMIVEYEGRVRDLIEKIKGELQNRKELKKKIQEAKQREALQLQILERMEESEKMVRKQLELVDKMEDHESLKMLETIKTYEQMLEEQTNVWKKYKEEYESLPMVKEVRKAETRYLNATIKYRMTLQKMKEARRKVQLRNMVRKRQEQLQIIRFAELYVEYVKKQKRCQELWDQNKKLTAQAQQLRQEREEKEKAKQQQLDAELQKVSALMKPQQLPQVDMSRYIIQRNKGNDKLDTMSINSYILEEEYINNNGQSSEQLNSSHLKAMDVDNENAVLMDIDSQEVDSQERELLPSGEPPSGLYFKGASNNEGKTQCTLPVDERNNNEMQNHMQTDSSNQSRTQVVEHNRTLNHQVNRQSEDHPNARGNKTSSRKRINETQQQNAENAQANESFTENGQLQNESSNPYERPVPTPVKMSKSSFQEKHPQQQSSHVSRRTLHESQQHNQFQKRSSQEVMQQQHSSRPSSQEMMQHQSSRFSSQEMMQQQSSRPSSQEMVQQQQQFSRSSRQEMYQQQQTPRQTTQEMYQQRQASRDVYQQNQQQHVPRETYQQSQQRQVSREAYQPAPRQPSPQRIYQPNQQQQEVYSRSEQRQAPRQQFQPMQVSAQNSEQMDFSRLPSNKPRIVSAEYANYDVDTFQRRQQTSFHESKAESTPKMLAETPTTSMSASSMPKAETTPFAYHVPMAQPSLNVTPMSIDIEPSSMMSTSMYSGDLNLLPDNISAILGSEITEPGGSMEFARRMHETDGESDFGDYEIDKQVSPIVKRSPEVPRTRPSQNASAQPPANNPANENPQDSNELAFNFAAVAKRTSNTQQRFFEV